MDYKARPRLGPLGSMMEIPSPSAKEGVELGEELIGARQTSMYGRTTTDVFDHKGSWGFRWPYATPEQFQRLRMLWLRPPPALRFWDPFRSNLLKLSKSVNLGVGDSELVRTGAGSVVVVPKAWSPAAANPIDMVPGDDYWLCTGGGTLGFTSEYDVPLLGQTTLSALVRGSGSVSMAYRVRAATNALSAPQYGASVTLGTTPAVVSVTVPAQTGIGLAPFLSTGGNVAAYIHGAAAELGPARGVWEPGGSCPEVFIADSSYKYLPIGRYDISFSLREV